MQSLWNDQEAASFNDDPILMRVYSSRLLGKEPALVLHGGGNTSVKAHYTNLFGEAEEVLYVKGSGWDLATIEAAGFAPVKLDVLQRMAELDDLSDTAMVQAQRAAMLNPYAPNPSVEAILHAILPFRFVDHTHADATVTVSNTPSGAARIQALYGDDCLIIPYVMPGFVLAKKVYELSKNADWSKYKGMILMNHGVFSFADDAKTSYENMLELVNRAEAYLHSKLGAADHLVSHRSTTSASLSTSNDGDAKQAQNDSLPSQDTLLQLAEIRQAVSQVRGTAVLVRWNRSDLAQAFANHAEVGAFLQRGPLTPDHVIRTKRTPVIINDDVPAALQNYAEDYHAYFERNKSDGLTCLNPAPCWAVWSGQGTLSFGRKFGEASIIHDITAHTLPAILAAEQLEAWQALPEKDVFEVEYWELEQAKLRKGTQVPALQGKIALVTGAASGIGKACVESLQAQGAAVVALDLNADIVTQFNASDIIGMTCDVTDSAQLQAAVAKAVASFGGLDIVISNAGTFPASSTIADMPEARWEQSMAVNLTAHQRLLTACAPFLQRGIDPAIIMIASKNVPAPGPGAAAYSVAKAGQTQLARVAALEMAKFGVRVNVLHPNAVFDTAIWTDEVLEKRAAHYGLSVEQYKTNNLLRQEVTAKDVAELAAAMAGALFGKTTGAQVPIDGGNERVV